MSIGAVVLAAGFSRRLGRPKQDVILNNEALLARAVRLACEAALHPIIAVVQDPKWIERLAPSGAVVLVNEHAHEGMATSVVRGVQHAQRDGLDGLVLMTCDQPALTPDHLRALCAEPSQIRASRYAGRNGVPAYFPASAFAELLELRGDAGARDLLRSANALTNEALALDIDTEEDLQRARHGFTR